MVGRRRRVDAIAARPQAGKAVTRLHLDAGLAARSQRGRQLGAEADVVEQQEGRRPGPRVPAVGKLLTTPCPLEEPVGGLAVLLRRRADLAGLEPLRQQAALDLPDRGLGNLVRLDGDHVRRADPHRLRHPRPDLRRRAGQVDVAPRVEDAASSSVASCPARTAQAAV